MTLLKDKNIIITGAASGIGKAIVEKCINNLAVIHAMDIDKAGLENLKYQLNTDRLIIYHVDVSKPCEIENTFKKIIQYSINLYGLVNNAGIYLGKSIFEYSENEIDKVLSVNIKSAVVLSKIFAENMFTHKNSGVIINISSVAGQEGSSDAIYGLSKAALLGLTKSNALNFSPFIRVNAIAPGLTETPMLEKISNERKNDYRENELIKKSIKPEDIANTVSFLLSDLAKHYTGAVFDLNNGCYIR